MTEAVDVITRWAEVLPSSQSIVQLAAGVAVRVSELHAVLGPSIAGQPGTVWMVTCTLLYSLGQPLSEVVKA
jgi:hypothetical protein